MLLLGVIQAQAAGGAAGSFDLLETQVLSSSAASVTFSGLSAYAADYQHLQIRGVGNSNRNQFSNDPLNIQFNSDTGANYSWHTISGFNSAVTSYANTSRTAIEWDRTLTTGNASIFGGFVIDILDPFETTKNTTARCLSGNNALPSVQMHSGAWYNTAALTSILLYPGISTFTANTRFSLYGVRTS